MTGPAPRRGWRQLLAALAWAWAFLGLVAIAIQLPETITATKLVYAGLTKTYLRTPIVPKELDGRRLVPFPVHDTVGTSRTLDLSSGTSLILIYDKSCSVCHKNMARWLELILEARSKHVPVYALSRAEAGAQYSYWRGFENSVEIYSPTDSVMLTTAFSATGTPCTVLVHDGVVAGVFQGVVDPSRFKWLVRGFQSGSRL